METTSKYTTENPGITTRLAQIKNQFQNDQLLFFILKVCIPAPTTTTKICPLDKFRWTAISWRSGTCENACQTSWNGLVSSEGLSGWDIFQRETLWSTEQVKTEESSKTAIPVMWPELTHFWNETKKAAIFYNSSRYQSINTFKCKSSYLHYNCSSIWVVYNRFFVETGPATQRRYDVILRAVMELILFHGRNSWNSLPQK